MADFFSLQDQVAVITGGTSGIGLEAAKRFIANGAKVVISGRKDGTAIAEEIGAKFVQCDVSKEEAVESLMEATKETFGNLDIVVNNAGANFGYNLLMESEISDFDKNFAITLTDLESVIGGLVPLAPSAFDQTLWLPLEEWTAEGSRSAEALPEPASNSP